MNAEELSLNMSVNCEKWRLKYIDLDNYMKGNIYHYTNTISLENIIKSNTLWVTESDFLNDRTEYIYAISLIEEIFNRRNYKNLRQDKMRTIIKILKSFINRSFIFSSSLNKDSVNLWGNYSKFDGYNIDFNLEKISKRMWDGKVFVVGNKKDKNSQPIKHMITRKDQYKTVIMLPGKVIYERKEQENIIVDILDFIDNTYKEYYDYLNIYVNTDETERNYKRLQYTFNSIISTAIDILSTQVQLFKNPIFSQDEEYRIIFNINSKLDVIKYRASNGVFIPYIEVKFESGLEKDEKGLPIDGITIGPKNNLDIARNGLKLFLNNQGYNTVFDVSDKKGGKIYIKKSEVPLRY